MHHTHDVILYSTHPSSLLLVQIFNFVYSLPQLFKIVPCPRHRLPVFDPKVRWSARLLVSEAGVGSRPQDRQMGWIGSEVR